MNIAIIGGGKIVPEFLKAVRAVPGLTVCGIWTRRPEAAAALAQQYVLPCTYPSYPALLADPAVDAVYVALPNALHVPFADQALCAGKHVLLEKPFAVTEAGARALADRAAQHGVFLFEMITNRYCPAFAAAQALLPQLGPIRLASFCYAQYSSRYARFCAGVTDPVFDPALGGGALMDLNVYNLHLAMGLLSAPRAVHYAPHTVRGIDTSGVLALDMDGVSVTLTAAKDCAAPSGFTLAGERGCMVSTAAPNVFDSFTLRLRDAAPQEFSFPVGASRMVDELTAFRDRAAARDDRFFRDALAHSLRVVSVLETAWRGAGLTLGGE